MFNLAMKRIAVVVFFTAAAFSARAEPQLSPEKAESICRDVLSRFNANTLEASFLPVTDPEESDLDAWRRLSKDPGTYPNGIARVDYNFDGKLDRLAVIYSGGSCPNEEIFNLALAKSQNSEDQYVGLNAQQVADDEELRWAAWEASERMANILGEPVVIAGNANELRVVSWYGEGAKRPLCAFSRSGNLKANIIADQRSPLCRAVVEERIAPLPARPLDETHVEALRLKDAHVDGASVWTLDMDGDGRTEQMYLLEQISGAGCGIYRQWADLPVDSPFAAYAEVVRGLSPVFLKEEPKTQWESMRAFRFDKRIYFLARGTDDEAGVYGLDKAGLSRRCAFKVREQYTISKRYFTPVAAKDGQ